MRSFQQNPCHRNPTSRGPQTVIFKVVFDITCGIGDFRAYIFCPPPTQELPKKHHEAGSSEQVPTYALSQIDYGHTVDTFEIAKRFLVPKNYAKDTLGNSSRGMCLAWCTIRPPPPHPPRFKTLRRLCLNNALLACQRMSASTVLANNGYSTR